MAQTKKNNGLKLATVIIFAVCLLYMLIAPYANGLSYNEELGREELTSGFFGGESNYCNVFTVIAKGSPVWISLVIFVALYAFMAIATYVKPLSKVLGWVSILTLANWIVMLCLMGNDVYSITKGDNLLDVDVVYSIFWIALPIILVGCVFAFITMIKLNPKAEEADMSWGEKAAKEAAATAAKKKAEEAKEEAARQAAKKKA